MTSHKDTRLSTREDGNVIARDGPNRYLRLFKQLAKLTSDRYKETAVDETHVITQWGRCALLFAILATHLASSAHHSGLFISFHGIGYFLQRLSYGSGVPAHSRPSSLA